MERIAQRGDYDCGVACVAMLIQRYAACPASSSYDAARAVLFSADEIEMTDMKDIKRALAAFGIKTSNRRQPFDADSKNDLGLGFDAIIGTKPRKDESWHWMVWDSQRQILMDPLSEGSNRRTVTHYVRIG
jgi:predicted double-glycine peptidase